MVFAALFWEGLVAKVKKVKFTVENKHLKRSKTSKSSGTFFLGYWEFHQNQRHEQLARLALIIDLGLFCFPSPNSEKSSG